MQVTTKNGIQVKLKRNTTPEYADEFNRCSISNKMYEGEIMATSEEVALVYAEGKTEKIIIAINRKRIILDCEVLDGEDLEDFCEALATIKKRHKSHFS